MKTLNVLSRLTILTVLALRTGLAAPAGAFYSPGPGITLDGKLSCPYVLGSGGRSYLQLSVITPEMGSPHRRPLNLAIVLDRSGSMGSEQKIENARAAVRTLVDQLEGEDLLSIVIYDDIVEVLRSSARVGDKEAVKRLIDEVYPRGWTNLGGGLMEGYRQVECNVSRRYVNRVILLSDGLANRGVTDPEELADIARRHRSASISLTSVGVGLEYNENLMIALAECGGGSYYFVEHARHLASMFRKEFNSLARLIAQNATLLLTLTPNTRVLDIIGAEGIHQAGRHAIELGDLYSNERRDITVALEVPEGHGRHVLATASLEYATEGRERITTNPVSISISYTHDRAEVEKHRNAEIEARAEVATSTRQVEDALKALDRGDKGEAVGRLQDMQRSLAASPAAAAGGVAAEMISIQQDKIRAYVDTLRDINGNVSRAKKSIQYDNYRTQKQK